MTLTDSQLNWGLQLKAKFIDLGVCLYMSHGLPTVLVKFKELERPVFIPMVFLWYSRVLVLMSLGIQEIVIFKEI